MRPSRPFALLLCPTAKEKVVGWYSSGTRLRSSDLDINQLFGNYCETPVLVICEVQVCFSTRDTQFSRISSFASSLQKAAAGHKLMALLASARCFAAAQIRHGIAHNSLLFQGRSPRGKMLARPIAGVLLRLAMPLASSK